MSKKHREFIKKDIEENKEAYQAMAEAEPEEKIT